MKLQYTEGNSMTTNNNEAMGPDFENIETIDDDAILALAKERLAIKKNLFYQTIDFLLIMLCLIALVITWDYGTKVVIFYSFSLFWGIRLLYRIFKFAKPSFKDGIASYIKKRNDFKLESEFNKIKKEWLSSQYNINKEHL